MADNVAVKDFSNASATIATDEVGGVQYQRVKIAVGADGVAADLAPGQGLMAASVPVVIASDQSAVPVSGTFWQATQPVSGTVAVTNADLTTLAGAVTATHMQSDVLAVPAPLSTTGGGTEASALRVTLATDSTGLVSIDDNAGSITVDGPLTDTQLRATAVPISYTAYTVVITATITRDSEGAAYTAGDVISTDAGAVLTFTNCARANGGSGYITDAVLIDSVAGNLDAELYLFDTTIAAQADHAAFDISDAEAATYLGKIDFGNTPDVSASNALYTQANVNLGFVCGATSRNLFGRLVARSDYDAANGEVFTIRLKIMQD